MAVMALAILATSLQTSGERFEFTQVHMGVATRLIVVAASRDKAESAARAAFDRIEQLEALFSDYRPSSEISRLSANAGGDFMPISRETALLLAKAEEVRRESHGLFDVTAGPLVALWRRSRDTGALPTFDEVCAARSLVDGRQVHVRERPTGYEARLARRGMRIDFGGIAKGFACDEAMRMLSDAGVASGLIEMGGDIAVRGRPPGAAGWTITIPSLRRAMVLTDCAISTSGDTEQFIEIGGRRYGHIVDLRTGYGTVGRVQATVIAPSGFDTDPWATALSAGGLGLAARARRILPVSAQVFVRVASN